MRGPRAAVRVLTSTYRIMKTQSTQPRGLRNNNPLNIRKNSTQWQGLRDVQTDPAFFQFETMAHGYRAAFKTLDTYRTKHGCRYLADFISRWAPPSENDTRAYVRIVAQRAGLSDVSTIDTRNEQTMCAIVAAMSFVENGVEADMDEVREGWRLFVQL